MFKNDRRQIPEQNLENLVKSGPAKSWRNHGARENVGASVLWNFSPIIKKREGFELPQGRLSLVQILEVPQLIG